MKFKKLFEEKDEFDNDYYVKRKIAFSEDNGDKKIFSDFQMWKTINPGYHNDDYKMKFLKKVNPKDIKAEIPIKTENDMEKLQKLDSGFTYENKKYHLIGNASIIKSDILPKNVGVWEL